MKVSATHRDQLSRIALMQVENLALNALEAVQVLSWVRLVTYLILNTADGVLDVSFPGALAALARTKVFCDVNLIETYLETYAKTQLITWDRDAQTIGLPAGLGMTARQIASRANGAKGGRPRKTPKTGVVADQRQGNIVLPISGGKDVARENPAKTHLTGARDKLSLASKSSSEDKLRLDAMFKRIGPKAFTAAGFDDAKDMPNWGITRTWCAAAVEKGLTEDQTELLVTSVVAAVAERQRERGAQVSHLGYFTKAVEQAIAQGDIPEAPKTAEQRKAERAWEQAMQDYSSAIASGETGLRRPELADFLVQAAA
ncbi:hypothetical protein [Gluconobacter cadivus]|uniref:Uncharacterized protein n=1 Tax=Gluconobacter cadivus TaxID=2728101 RepID=A0ABR9YYJ7_9PROT|nr:hypothetical protein [Gluconobacter cadivus]MBF0889633.1 hypothetical protein [Gluconobacter cadivus]